MNRLSRLIAAALPPALLLAGCASVPKDAGFADVRAAVAERTGHRVRWNRLSPEDRAAESAVAELLADELTADEAVQVALLNNANLQATYEELGVAQAEVVQAGLLSNPVFDGEFKFHEDGGGLAFEGGIAQDFLGILQIPLRRRVAKDAFEAAKLRVTGAVIDLSGQVRSAFYAQEAAEQTLEMRQGVVAATRASYEFAQRLREAGNITDLDLAQERALFEQSKVDLARAEADVLDGRERLNLLMGLWGPQASWTVAPRLPELPEAEPQELDDIERQAVLASLDLAAARLDLQAAARALGIRRSFGLIPEAEAGVAAEHESDEGWSVGPSLSLPIPLFDQGQAATAAARAELEAARQRYVATAVEVRSAARASRNRLLAARAQADYYRRVILPLRREITERTQLQYNAMQIGAFQLLQAKQEEIEAGVEYIDALRDYWTARTQLEQITSGRLTDFGSGGSNTNNAPRTSGGGRGSGGH